MTRGENIDFNKHDIDIFINDTEKICGRHRAILQNYKVT